MLLLNAGSKTIPLAAAAAAAKTQAANRVATAAATASATAASSSRVAVRTAARENNFRPADVASGRQVLEISAPICSSSGSSALQPTCSLPRVACSIANVRGSLAYALVDGGSLRPLRFGLFDWSLIEKQRGASLTAKTQQVMEVLSQLRQQQELQPKRLQLSRDQQVGSLSAPTSGKSVLGGGTWVVGFQSALRLPRSLSDLQRQQQQQQLQGSLSVALAAAFQLQQVYNVEPQTARQALGRLLERPLASREELLEFLKEARQEAVVPLSLCASQEPDFPRAPDDSALLMADAWLVAVSAKVRLLRLRPPSTVALLLDTHAFRDPSPDPWPLRACEHTVESLGAASLLLKACHAQFRFKSLPCSLRFPCLSVACLPAGCWLVLQRRRDTDAMMEQLRSLQQGHQNSCGSNSASASSPAAFSLQQQLGHLLQRVSKAPVLVKLKEAAATAATTDPRAAREMKLVLAKKQQQLLQQRLQLLLDSLEAPVWASFKGEAPPAVHDGASRNTLEGGAAASE
ncbi:hypothetical protein cyc_08692 [Cyclospora cayetanensis]|uniref:Uncharacterized protein n=1 Tax=Cyclospora cayetanensis TaxID=88456 RepID=A0A1D3D4K6_9EIME|nr:hypothetical protein cyc_08692 [Cyclospora cayetanensis]